MMTKAEVAAIMKDTFSELEKLREAGQAEYAGGENAFGNFDRLAEKLKLDRKKILWVYLSKHLDGIEAYLNGHVSQREPVAGRINDVIVYLILLRAMTIDETSSREQLMNQHVQDMVAAFPPHKNSGLR